MVKAVALLSGGLDSTLAVKMMMEQGVEVHALNFTSAFCTCTHGKDAGCRSESKRVSDEFGIPLKVLVKGIEYIDIVRNPKHGYGKGMNPCVDCRVYMFKLAKQYMEEIGASFVITGEVLGQRPMSQRRETMRIIEQESGLDGYIVRPLCARHLEPTIPEKLGLIDREKLLDVSGRSRKTQIELAEELDINDYQCPSGGCLLTEKMFSKKVKDLLEHKPQVTRKDLTLLKAGRHFRYKDCKVVVGRNETDNVKLKSLVQAGDTFIEPVDFPGPVAIVTDDNGNGARAFAAGLILRYTGEKAGDRPSFRATRDGVSVVFEAAAAASSAAVEETRVC